MRTLYCYSSKYLRLGQIFRPAIAPQDGELLAPRRQVAKFGFVFSYLRAFASLREIIRGLVAAVPHCVYVVNILSQ